MKNPKKTRMCIRCRKRYMQKELLRLQNNNECLSAFSGRGRSFYVCRACINTPKIMQNILKVGKLKPSECHIQALKEIITVWLK